MTRMIDNINTINYSFIIPHHNSPDLLERCLDSIPQRQDIEIIVVDDNSDPYKKPHISRTDIRLIYIDAEHTRGAGRARNYGLKEAKGKWLIFADADDFYEKDFILELDKFKDTDFDIVIWDHYGTFDINTKRWKDGDAHLYMKALSYEPNNAIIQKALKFRVNAPWNKMYRASFIEKHKFQYEEKAKGNDAFFSMSAIEKAYKVGFIPKRLYYWVKTEGGLTHGKSKEGLKETLTIGKADKIKIRNRAWGALVPLHSGIKTVYNKYGLRFTLSHYSKKFFNGVPWLLVYFFRYRYVKIAKNIISKHQSIKQ